MPEAQTLRGDWNSPGSARVGRLLGTDAQNGHVPDYMRRDKQPCQIRGAEHKQGRRSIKPSLVFLRRGDFARSSDPEIIRAPAANLCGWGGAEIGQQIRLSRAPGRYCIRWNSEKE